MTAMGMADGKTADLCGRIMLIHSGSRKYLGGAGGGLLALASSVTHAHTHTRSRGGGGGGGGAAAGGQKPDLPKGGGVGVFIMLPPP